MREVLITGGSRGIGLSLVYLFKEKGYKVTCLDIVDPVKRIPGVNYEKCDISDYLQVEKIAKNYSSFDVLINNAAKQYINSLEKSSYEDNIEVINTNIIGTLNVTKAFLKHIKGGLIINVGSVHSSVPRTEKIPYDMSKAALSIFTKEIALELAKQNTRAVCVEFGAVSTPMNDNFKDEKKKKKAVSQQVIKHLLSSEEAAAFIYSLTNEECQYMNGSVIQYDCGRSLK